MRLKLAIGETMRIEELQAIFWDFDGVILDSNRVKNDAFESMFSSFGEAIVEKVLTHHKQHGGISRVEKIAHYYREFLGRPLSSEELRGKCDEFSNLVKERVIRCDWIPGAREFLNTFHNTLLMFVISGTPRSELQEIITKRGMERFFIEILGSPTKKQDHIRNVTRQYALSPSRCLFVGDALTDYNAARETGTRFIGIQGNVPFPPSTVVIPDCEGMEKSIGLV